MRTGIWLGVGLGVALLVGGCSSESDEPASAVQRCNDLEQSWCQRAVSCLIDGGTLMESDRAANLSECLDDSGMQLDCRKAVATSANYSQCLSDVKTMDCAKWNVPPEQLESVRLPDSCKGVILVEP